MEEPLRAPPRGSVARLRASCSTPCLSHGSGSAAASPQDSDALEQAALLAKIAVVEKEIANQRMANANLRRRAALKPEQRRAELRFEQAALRRAAAAAERAHAVTLSVRLRGARSQHARPSSAAPQLSSLATERALATEPPPLDAEEWLRSLNLHTIIASQACAARLKNAFADAVRAR
jgi:hypothetical protein